MLQIQNLSFEYSDKLVLQDVNLHLPAGSLLHLQGENGSGKSTLLKLIAGLLAPLEGDIRLMGETIAKARSNYQQKIAYIGHKLGISPILSLRENAQFDCGRGGLTNKWGEAVECLSLSGLEDMPCSQLSAGQQRRATLLRLCFSKAPLWLLDEPYITLDKKASDFLNEQLITHLHRGGGVVLTSHQSIPFRPENKLEYGL